MGLGPNNNCLRDRVGIACIEKRALESLRAEITLLQQERGLARALAQMKRREAAGPKPRKHKKHCLCLVASERCCRCAGVKCIKPKPKGRKKSHGN